MIKYIKKNLAEIILALAIIGWIGPTLHSISKDQGILLEKVETNTTRINNICDATKDLGIRLADEEMNAPVKISSFVADLKPLADKNEYAVMVTCVDSDSQLVYITANRDEAILAYAVTKNIIETQSNSNSIDYNSLKKLCESKGLDLRIDSSIKSEYLFFSRMPSKETLTEIKKSWNIVTNDTKNYTSNCSLFKDKSKPVTTRELLLLLTSDNLKCIAENSKDSN